MKKILFLVLILFLIAQFLITQTGFAAVVGLDYMEYSTDALAQATYNAILDSPTLLDSYTVYAGAGTGFNIPRGQSFKPSVSAVITSAKFWLNRTGSPTGHIAYALYGHTGTYGSDGVPSTPVGSPLAVSNTLDVSTIISDIFPANIYELTFPTGYPLIANTPYVIVAVQQADYVANGGYLTMWRSTSALAHPGNPSYLWSGVFWSSTSQDQNFAVYGGAFSLESYSESTIKIQGNYSR